MSIVRRVAKNIGMLLISDVISKMFMFFFIMYTARYLGVEGFGILSFGLAFTGIFGIFADLGLRQLMIREVARDNSLKNKYLANVLGMKFILSIITLGLIVFAINILDYPHDTIKVVYLLSIYVIFNAFIQTFYSVFQAFEKMEYQSIGQILNSILLLFGALFALKQGFDIVGFASLFFITSAIILGYSFVICMWKFTVPEIEVDWSFWKLTIKEALPFGLTGTFITIYLWIGSVILSLMKGDEVVGWYTAAYRLILVLLSIPFAFNGAIFPLMSQFHVNSQNSLRYAYEKLFKYMLIIGVPIGVGTTLLADKIILLIFGIEYLPSVIVLQILVWALVLIFARTAFERLLESIDRQIIITKIFGSCAVLNIVLNIILIPKYSYVGAGIATLLTDFTVFIMIFIWSQKIGYKIDAKNITNILLKVMVASLPMVIFIEYFKNLNILITIPVVIFIYLLTLYMVNGLCEDDINLFRKVFATKKNNVDSEKL